MKMNAYSRKSGWHPSSGQNTKITDAGVQELKKALPNCEIYGK